MNKIAATRRIRNMTQADLAEKVGVGVPQISKWENATVPIPLSRLSDIALALDVVVSDLVGDNDAERIAQMAAAFAPNAIPVKMEGAADAPLRFDLPVYGTALGADRDIDGEAIEQVTLNQAEVMQYVRRPTILDRNASAYGLYVAGSSMEPRHQDGEMLLVDPKGQVRSGEDVVVYLRPECEISDDGATARAVLVKRLVRRTASYIELEQYQPAQRFKLPTSSVLRLDRVIPWQELLG